MQRTKDIMRTKGQSDGRTVQQSRTPKRIIYSIAKASIFFFKKSFKQRVTKKNHMQETHTKQNVNKLWNQSAKIWIMFWIYDGTLTIYISKLHSLWHGLVSVADGDASEVSKWQISMVCEGPLLSCFIRILKKKIQKLNLFHISHASESTI